MKHTCFSWLAVIGVAALSGCATLYHPAGVTTYQAVVQEEQAPRMLSSDSSVLSRSVGMRMGGANTSQQFINCATNVPCGNTGPVNTGTGDPAYVFAYKTNTNIQSLWGMFGVTGLLIGNGGVGNPLTALSPVSTGTYCLEWASSVSSPPTLTNCPSGSGAFSALTGGTNITAAMLVGTGASLGVTGTGTITGTSLAGTPTNGQFWGYNGSAQGWYTPAGSGTINSALQYSFPYYSASGTASTLSGLASPTSGAGIYALRYDPTSTTAVAPTADQVGAHTRSLNGAATTDTVLYTDVLGLIVHDKAASGAVNETLPTPTSLTNTGFAYTYCNDSAQTDTITPTTWTIAVNGGTAGASISVATGVCAQISVDPFNATQWDAFTLGAPSSAVSAQTSGTSFTPVCTVGKATTVNTIVATGNLTINLPTGCADGQGVKLRIKFTASITYTFNAGYHAGTTTGITALPTASSSTSGEDYLDFDYDSANSRFNYLAIASF